MRKRSLRWYGAIALVAVLLLSVFIAGCQGAVGPTGPAGLAGPAGPAGTAGLTGSGGTAECSDCHNDTTLIKSRQVQAAASVHATGGNFERNSADCAICHTSEGFTEYIATGSLEIAGPVENPSPINCRTCHQIHDNYTEADFALRTEAPVTLKLTGDTFDGGQGNLCASCHQPRWGNPAPEVGGGDIEITTTRYYPHYGTQSSMLLGVGGYGESTGASIHYTLVENSCTTCHMADAYGNQAGGHTMSMEYAYHGSEVANLAGCTSCHSDIESFDHNGVQTDVQALLDELKELLLADGIMSEDELTVKGTYSSARVGAYWNYKTVKYGSSLGVHNPAYSKILLQTAIDTLK